MSNVYVASNSSMGKRKRGRNASGSASQLSRKLFGGKKTGGIQTVAQFDKFFSKSMKKRNMAEPEQKWFETVGQVNVSTTEVLYLFSGLTLGDGYNQRTGTKIITTKIEFFATLQMNGAATGGGDYGKIALFLDKQTNATAPVGLSVAAGLAGVPYNNNTAGYPMLKNAFSEDEYYIIKEFDFALDANAGVAGAWQGDRLNLKCEVPFRRTIQYTAGNTGTVADCITNALFLGTVGHNVLATAPTVMSYYIRLWFTDS